MKVSNFSKVLVLILAMTVMLPSMANDEAKAKRLKKLSWTGCGIVKKAFMKELSKAYQKNKGINIALTGGGATKGIRQVATRKTDMGGSCRFTLPSHPEEKEVRMEPVAWDALVVIVHKENPVSNITLRQIQGVYTGNITNWKDLGGPDKAIRLYARKGKTSGIGRNLRELVFANFNQNIVAFERFKGSSPVERSVEKDVQGIGVTGISSAKRRNVKVMTLEGRQPTFENIKTGAYVLYYPLYLVISTAEDRAEVLDFVQYAHSDDGRAVIRKAGTVPYLDALHLVMKQINQKQRARDLGIFKRF